MADTRMSDFNTPEKMAIETPSDISMSDRHQRADCLHSFDSREWNFITPQKMPLTSRELEAFSGKDKCKVDSVKRDGLEYLLSGAVKELQDGNCRRIEPDENSRTQSNLEQSGKMLNELEKSIKSASLNYNVDDFFKYVTPKKKLILEDKDSKEKRICELDYASNQHAVMNIFSSKPCTCRKSKCQKLYCDCFKSGLLCSPSCQCNSCHNNISSSMLSPFKSTGKEGRLQLSNQSLACNCLMSSCAKNYCDCYKANRQCSDVCRCRQCLNR